MCFVNNASVSYFDSENETDVLVNIYRKLYDISIDYNNLTILFVNLTGDMDTVTIYDLNKAIHYFSYSEYSDYSLLELENQIDMLYRDYYIKQIEFEPVVIIIHDATQMIDCADEYELVEYLNDKLSILKVMRVFVFCTIRN